MEREAELEDVTDAVLITQSDDFNAVAAAELRPEVGHGHVFRVAPDPAAQALLPPAGEGGILGNHDLTFAEVSRRFAAGARFVARRDAKQGEPFLVVSPDGRLRVVEDRGKPIGAAGDMVICLVPSSERVDG